jgi:hypothetical protein
MRVLAVLVLTGCLQQTVYVGPRVDDSGDVAIELGASLGFSAPVTRRGAIVASVDTTQAARISDTRDDGAIARGAPPAEAPPRGEIRGVLEWVQRPRGWRYSDDVERLAGIGWRAGIYGGAQILDDDDATKRGIVGATATISPWVWGLERAMPQQYFALGVQLGVEAITGRDGEQRYAARAALACEMQLWPR